MGKYKEGEIREMGKKERERGRRRWDGKREHIHSSCNFVHAQIIASPLD